MTEVLRLSSKSPITEKKKGESKSAKVFRKKIRRALIEGKRKERFPAAGPPKSM